MPYESPGLSLGGHCLGQVNGDLSDPIYVQGFAQWSCCEGTGPQRAPRLGNSLAIHRQLGFVKHTALDTGTSCPRRLDQGPDVSVRPDQRFILAGNQSWAARIAGQEGSPVPACHGHGIQSSTAHPLDSAHLDYCIESTTPIASY